jgi:multiple sugar transport system substrate-binding protein
MMPRNAIPAGARRGVGRRRARLTTVAALSAVALVGCGGGTSEAPGGTSGSDTDGEPVELEFWGWVPHLEDVVEEWNEQNPNIQVSFYRMTGDDGDKIPAAIDAGTAPDIVQMSVHSLPGHVINNRLVDLSDYTGDLAGDFTDSSWGTVSFGDGVYGVPQDSGPGAMMYRADLFEEHGVEVPTTWAEYVEAGRALKAADPDLYIGQFSPNETGLWMQAIWQNGGTWTSIDGDTWVAEVNGEESLEVADLWQTLLDEELVKVVEMWTPEYWAEINAGTIATINYAAWFPALLEESAAEQSGLWAVAPMPMHGDEPAAGESGGGALVIPTGTEHIAQAYKFIEWLNSGEEGVEFLITDGGVFPASVKGFEHPALLEEREFFGGQVINEVFVEAAGTVPDSWTAGPTHDLTQQNLQDQFGRVATGELTFREALDAVQESTIREIRDMGLNVRE